MHPRGAWTTTSTAVEMVVLSTKVVCMSEAEMREHTDDFMRTWHVRVQIGGRNQLPDAAAPFTRHVTVRMRVSGSHCGSGIV